MDLAGRLPPPPSGPSEPQTSPSDLVGAVQFLRTVFDGSGDVEEGRPAEIRIGDSLVMVTPTGQRDLFPAFLYVYVYVYVADATYRRALQAGAETLEAPLDRHTTTGAPWCVTPTTTSSRSRTGWPAAATLD